MLIHSPRIVSIDVYRGLVLLLLMPNAYSAWGIGQVASAFPDSTLWQAAAALFTHVAWTGMSVWDMVMPSFLLLMGASIPFSMAARRARGEPFAWTMLHSATRAVAFVLLGVLLSIRPGDLVQEAAPIVLLAALALPGILADTAGVAQSRRWNRLWLGWSAVVLVFAAGQAVATVRDPGIHHFGNVLVQAGLAWVPACLLVGRGRPLQWAWLLVGLTIYGAAFVLYPLPPADVNLAQLGVAPTDERFDGLWAHWNKNTNLASAVDAWFFGLWPRTTPFEPSAHGYQVFNFVPTIASIAFGIMAGEAIRSSRDAATARNRLLRDGAMLVALGAVAALTICPLVKSIWTPSWALLSAGVATLTLALLHHACEVRQPSAWTRPLVWIGANAILLYVLSYYPWRLLTPWRKLLGPWIADSAWSLLLQSLLIALTLTAVAALLARRRIFLRI